MKKLFFIGFTFIIWVISLIQGTELGGTLNITSKSQMMLTIIISIIFLFKFKKLRLKKSDLLLLISIFLSFIFIPYIRIQNTTGIGYLYAFGVVYIMDNISIKEEYIRLTSLIYGVLGIVFLSFYNFTDILNGWNTNSVAMIGFFSYMVFYLGDMKRSSRYNRLGELLVVGIYLALLEVANSRSSTLFILINLIFIFRLINPIYFYKKNYSTIILMTPLIIAIVVIFISKTSLFQYLEMWSYEAFNKPIFNGRDKIWESGLNILKNNFLFGQGKIGNGWHNSAITCLAAFGIIGYGSWIMIFNKIINKAKPYLQDIYICKSITAFFLVYLQQTLELGLMATNPNFIPYVILGILMGRIKYFKGCEEIETIS